MEEKVKTWNALTQSPTSRSRAPDMEFSDECEEYQKELQTRLGSDYMIRSMTIITDPSDEMEHYYLAKVLRKRN